MPAFDTPTPISVTLDLVIGDARITAGDRDDTVVEVRPSDPAKAMDVAAAEQTTVEYQGGELMVKAPRQRGYLGIGSGKGASVDVTVHLPAGSQVRGAQQMGSFHAEGLLGECDLKTGSGDISLGLTGPVRLRTDLGDVTVGRVSGDAELTTGGGLLSVRGIGGSAVIKNLAGECSLGELGGEARVHASAGDIVIERAHADVRATTDAGQIRVQHVSRGSVTLESGGGALEIGIADGTSAWIDAQSQTGSVRNLLDNSDQPRAAANSVEVRARTQYGDIVVRRSTPALQD